MKNFFFAPSKACLESDSIATYLRTIGNIRVAEPNQKANSDLLRRLANSSTRSDVTHIACILAAPTVNIIVDEIEIGIGRGLTDIGDEALQLNIPTYILRQESKTWFFYPIINLDRARSKNDWKLDYSRAILDNPQTAEELFICPHNWKTIDDSFDHAFGTERIKPYDRCAHCDITRETPERGSFED